MNSVHQHYYRTVLVVAASVALFGSSSSAQDCGDVDNNGSIVSTDALLVLKSAVGQPVPLACPPAVLRTGQAACYDATGIVISCAGTEQDGELQAGHVQTFTNNGDGTITDHATGLMWEAKCDGPSCDMLHDRHTTYTWDQAFTSHIATLNSMNFAGYGDWRVPNVNELQSLANYGTFAPSTYSAFDACAGDRDVTDCSCTTASDHWTSTSLSEFPNNAFVANFNTGAVIFGVKTTVRHVRAVRNGL